MNRNKGFTLVELLVVISIIAMLLAVLMPALSKAREQGRRMVCETHLKTIGLANSLYASQNGGSYVPWWWYGNSYPNGGFYWCDNPTYRKYVSVDDVKNDAGKSLSRTMPLKYKCPSDKKKAFNNGTEYVDLSYGINYAGLPPKGNKFVPGTYYCFKENQIKEPGTKLAFADGQSGGLWYGESNYKSYWDRFGDLLDGNITGSWNMTSYRHSEGANILFYDGHVGYYKKERVFRFRTDNPRIGDDAVNYRLWIPKGDGKLYCD